MNGIQGNHTSIPAQNASQLCGMKKKLTQKRLKELLNYNPDTGLFTWKVYRSYNAKKGGVAGCFDKDGYVVIRVDDILYKAARLAFLYMDGYFPEGDTDHKFRNVSDNRWNEIRHISHQCNMRNSGISKNNTSGVVGVYFAKDLKKWKAQICVNYKIIALGSSSDKTKAVFFRWEGEKKYGFPNCCTKSSAFLYLKKHGCLK